MGKYNSPIPPQKPYSSIPLETSPRTLQDVWEAFPEIHYAIPSLPMSLKEVNFPYGGSGLSCLFLKLFFENKVSEETIHKLPFLVLSRAQLFTSSAAVTIPTGVTRALQPVSTSILSGVGDLSGSWPTTTLVAKVPYRKNNSERMLTDIMQLFQNHQYQENKLLFSSRSRIEYFQYWIEDGIKIWRSHDNEFGEGIYMAENLEIALPYATEFGGGVVLVFDRDLISEKMQGRTKFLANTDWEQTLKRRLARLSVPLVFTPSDTSLVIGPLCANNDQVKHRRSIPIAAEEKQWVVINHVQHLEGALIGAIYIEK